MSFELLSEPIRKYIRDKRWESLRPIQAAAINKILTTDRNYILASRTASGKTEAAFLPILSKVNFDETGVQVLYISPLIALINDQFYRIEELCKYLDVDIIKWHGEANKTLKTRLIKNPKGVVLITPESIEAMFVHSPYTARELFSNLKYVIIDEIHSFIGTDRGVHLKSLLSRLQEINATRFNIVGLSATIGDYTEAKKMTGDENNTTVLLDRATKEMETHFRFYHGETTELPAELVMDLYEQTKDNKVLIFPNSRGRAEEIAVKLRKISDKVKGHPNYFSHHSSVDKELREYVEHFAKTSQRNNFCISCTSTLELGIDIGSVDEVVQIDATHSVASLIQRVGRSGRRDGEKSILFLYATNKWSLLQSIACWSLYQIGFIEPNATSTKPYDILLHQILSIIKQTSGCSRKELSSKIKLNFSFKEIADEDIEEIINFLLNNGLLEIVERDIIIGIDGEKIVNSRDFYSVFKSEPQLKVVNSGRPIGEVPFSIQIKIGENILLAARIWKIVNIDSKAGKIEVVPAKDGKKPLFFGSGGTIHPQIRQRMFELLLESNQFPELDEGAAEILRELRIDFSNLQIENQINYRPIICKDRETILFTFQGTKVNRSLNFLLNKVGVDCVYEEISSTFEIPIVYSQIQSLFEELKAILKDIDSHLENALTLNSSMLSFSKWGGFLPVKYQVEILKERYFDFASLNTFLRDVKTKELAN